MIVRMWQGRVPRHLAAEYRAFLIARAIPDYRSTPGNVSVRILEREDVAVTHFVTLTIWKDLASIRRFAGEPVDQAKYYPEDQRFLLEFPPTVQHYEIVGAAGEP